MSYATDNIINFNKYQSNKEENNKNRYSYNFNYNVNYHLVEDNDESNETYRLQLLEVFCDDKSDKINNEDEVFDLITNKIEFLAPLILKDEKLKQYCTALGSQLFSSCDMGVVLLFSYHYFHITHKILNKLINNETVSDDLYRSIEFNL